MTLDLATLLTARRSETLRAAVNRIIPADDDPSGWDAGVGDYFLQLLTREPRYVSVYQNGLDALEAEAGASGSSFAALDTGQQDALLARAEAGETRTPGLLDAAAFFRLLVEQTMEGFYADPGNGGNKNGVAWDMIGYRVTG